MYRFVIVCILLLSCSDATAQSYRVLPDDTLVVVAAPNELTIFDIYQENLTQESLVLGWRTVENRLPSGWDFSVCDLGSCYPGLPVEGGMNAAGVGEMAFLGLNVDPRGVEGVGVARIYVYDVKHPDDGDTLTWIVKAQTASVSTSQTVDSRIYPTPFVHTFSIQFGSVVNGDVIVRNSTGQEVGRSVAHQVDHIMLSLPDLPDGYYFVQYPNVDGYSVSKIVKLRK